MVKNNTYTIDFDHDVCDANRGLIRRGHMKTVFLFCVLLIPGGVFAAVAGVTEVIEVAEAANVRSDIFGDLRIAANNRTDMQRLDEAAQIWLHKNTKEIEQKAWTKKWEERVKDAESGVQSISEENYTADTFYNFCSDNKDNLKNPDTAKKSDKMFLVMLFRRTIEKRFHLHSKIKEHLTPENIKKIIDVLVK